MDQYLAEVAPLANAWWDWKQDQDAEAEPLNRQETEAAEDDSPAENDGQDDQEDEEHGAA
ncbi:MULTISPECIES: hypothetical protein [Bacillus]|nr:hypothetical protein [Bacillus sonorensis]MCY8027183.1 hypothetical protein [Bacillus sonorensis]MDI3412218.1 hypothetical protein [Bacillus sonorensis]MEC1590619.1 hypothetical protein [Bacillus sonorensis]GIN67438.1 hypothetical protein J41TS2_28590 [Bacillus sonorensis]